MSDRSSPMIILPGGDGDRQLTALKAKLEADEHFKMIGFPSWQPYVPAGFSAERLIADLTAHIESHVPHGPLRIAGYSLGAHLGYVAAVSLQAAGRDIAGFCAIDAVIRNSPLRKGLELLGKGQFGDFFQLVRSKLRNSMIRVTHKDRLLGPTYVSDREAENALVVWLDAAYPWILSLDHNPVALDAPAVLLRTRPAAGDDAAWRRRCPKIQIHEVPGTHQTLLKPENIDLLRDAFVNATRDWR